MARTLDQRTAAVARLAAMPAANPKANRRLQSSVWAHIAASMIQAQKIVLGLVGFRIDLDTCCSLHPVGKLGPGASPICKARATPILRETSNEGRPAWAWLLWARSWARAQDLELFSGMAYG